MVKQVVRFEGGVKIVINDSQIVCRVAALDMDEICSLIDYYCKYEVAASAHVLQELVETVDAFIVAGTEKSPYYANLTEWIDGECGISKAIPQWKIAYMMVKVQWTIIDEVRGRIYELCNGGEISKEEIARIVDNEIGEMFTREKK